MNPVDKVVSYSSANTLPGKLLRIARTCLTYDLFIKPIHFQLCPTNACNLNCAFCSCSAREKSQQLSLKQVQNLSDIFYSLGSAAVTITGGGEPCCHPNLPEIIRCLSGARFKLGLVTNGYLIERILKEISLLTWCRVSVSDDRDLDKLFSILFPLVTENKIDWAFSYVVTRNFKIQKFAKAVQFANDHGFTHVRAVSDLLDLDRVPSPVFIRELMKEYGVDDSIVIYQSRQEYSMGTSKCKISLLKPVIAPDGFVYPCCGVQYALPETQGVFPEEMRMCHIEDIPTYFASQKVYEGSSCYRCYYQEYNTALDCMTTEYDHLEFV